MGNGALLWNKRCMCVTFHSLLLQLLHSRTPLQTPNADVCRTKTTPPFSYHHLALLVTWEFNITSRDSKLFKIRSELDWVIHITHLRESEFPSAQQEQEMSRRAMPIWCGFAILGEPPSVSLSNKRLSRITHMSKARPNHESKKKVGSHSWSVCTLVFVLQFVTIRFADKAIRCVIQVCPR